MVGFLNERSLHNHSDWKAALGLFLAAAQELSITSTVLLKDTNFFGQAHFLQLFNNLDFAKDQRARARDLVFGSRYYKCWRPERVSNPADQYSSAAPPLQLQDESICEAAERKLADAEAIVSLLSASDSVFNGNSITISNLSSGLAAEVRNASTLEAVRQWIVTERGYYDHASRSAPRDFQTILMKAPARFRVTGKLERRFRRKVFEEIATHRLYYVDEGHPGDSAHLEVFSATGEHLGTADISTGELNIDNRVTGRRLRQ